MKHKILITLFFFSLITLKAQAQIEPGDKKIQVGIRGYGISSGLTGSFDYGLTNWFSVGAGADFYFQNNKDNFYLFGRGNFHLGEFFHFDKNMDLYPGVDLGFSNTGLKINARLGFRYFFTPSFGSFIELGSHGALGLVFNLN